MRQEALQKHYNNLKFMQPYQLAMSTCEVMVELRRWHWQECAAVTADVSLADLKVCLPALPCLLTCS